MSFDFQSAKTRASLARRLLHRGQPELARQVCREALRLSPRSSGALDVMSEVEARAGRLDEAEQLAALAFETSGNPAPLIGAAEALARAGRGERARALWADAEGALRWQLRFGCGHHGLLARVLLARGGDVDVAEALELADFEATRRDDAGTHACHAWALERAGRLDDARRVITGALARRARDPELFVRAGKIEEARGDADRAREWYRLALERDPGHPVAQAAVLALLRRLAP